MYVISRILAVAALLAGSHSFAAKLEVELVPEKTVGDLLERGNVRPAQRQAVIREMFTDAGCSADEQRVDGHSSNVICTLPGETNSTIVIGGHFDFAEHGRGIVDDWSGVSLLPSLYRALKGQSRQHTYIFVAFAAEERGLVGSSRYVKNLTSEQRSLIRAFVNLECLGLNTVKVWAHRSTPALVSRLNEVGAAINVALQAVNVEKIGDDDTHPFLSAHIPVISIHSVTQETLYVLHSERDTMEAIRLADYYEAYKLVAYYLAYLDVKAE